VVRTDNETNAEVQRFIVPIIYSPKEKMITRIMSDPDLMKQIQTILPRMCYEITGITYDASRKQNSLNQLSGPAGSTTAPTVYSGVPYDIAFSLYVYSRNIDDGTHIVEQILPFFTPDFTVTSNMVPDLGFLKDVPITLNSVSNEIDYEGNFDSVRYVYWTLNFTMKTYFYGPITNPKYIRTAYTNLWEGGSKGIPNYCGYTTRLIGGDIQGNFKKYDTVYQGRSLRDADAYGTLMYFSANTGELTIGATQGAFTTNNRVHAVSTNGNCNVVSYLVPPIKDASLKITPDPITAVPGDDYGYSYEVTVYPEEG
jgi:hypothetical protein